jgi:hypothetical protein
LVKQLGAGIDASQVAAQPAACMTAMVCSVAGCKQLGAGKAARDSKGL